MSLAPLQQIPADIVNLGDFEPHARERMEAQAFAYLSGGAGDEQVLRAFRVQGFAATDDKAYDVLRETARVLQLDLSQMRG